MKVLIIGGTGVMGAHLVELLSEKYYEIFVTSRGKHESNNRVKYIQGNAQDLGFLQTILSEKWDAVIDFMIYSTEAFEKRVNLFLTATAQYIFISTGRVYDNSKQPITEESVRLVDASTDKDFLSTDEYSLSKARQENLLKNSGKRNWTIIRPYITYGENRLQLGVWEKEEWLYRAIHGRTIVFSKDIVSKKTTLSYGLDVSKGIAAVIGEKKAIGETYNITYQEQGAITWSNVLEIYLSVLEKHLGHRPRVLLQDLDDFLEFRPGISKYQVLFDRLYDRDFDSTKITQIIDTKRFIKTEIGLRNCLEEFLKNPTFKYINWHMEAKKDRETGELAKCNEIKGIKPKLKYLGSRFLRF